MKIGILSDTHDEIDRTRTAIEKLRTMGADVLIHCGDITGPEIVNLFVAIPSWFVFGNHDADRVPELRTSIHEIGGVCLEWGGELKLPGKCLAVTHGHMHTDVRRLLASKPDYLFSGHSHIINDQMQDKTRRINPGALSDTEWPGVAMLNLANGVLMFVRIGTESC